MGFGFLTEGRKTSGRNGERSDEIKPDEKRPYQATNSFIRSRSRDAFGSITSLETDESRSGERRIALRSGFIPRGARG